YASRALWALGAWGRVDEAREWLARIPAIVQSRDTHSRLSAAAILAFGERNAEGLRMAQDALSDPSTPPEMVLVALRVATSAAGFADQPGLMHALLVNWPPVPVEQVGPLYRFNQLNVMSYVALHAGDTDRLRALAAEAQSHGADRSLLLAQALSRMLVGLGHLWDGNPGRAVEVLHGPLLAAEREHGRRSMIACLLASILAQAFVQLDQHDAARLLLANRLDVIERTGFPDNVLAAYDALIHAALARGDEVSAMAALKGLDALAQRRQLPRLQLHTLAERIRLLALKGCNETVAGLLPGLDALVDEFEPEVGRPFHDQARLVAATTRAHAALASGHLAEADRQLDTAAVLAETTRRGRDACMVKVLRAVVARKRGESGAQALLLETINLAALSGNVRLLADTHPLALEMARELEGGVVLSHASASMDAPDRKAHVSESGLLTPKEEEILGLLERGMSNKRIALTLGIGAETVKWHLKNLFSKLSAGSREHAVERARLLGLVA
ncbi:MAG: LuxR C-terminal-related transcriptional regulator, partial [Thermomonas sp.]